MQRGISDEAVTKLHARDAFGVAVADRDLHVELACVVVHEQNAECPVVDEARGQVRDAREQLIELQNRAELAADLRERLESARVLTLALEEAGVFDCDGDVGAELPEQRLVGLGELARSIAEKIQRADDAALTAERHDQLGEGAGYGFDIPGILTDVVDEQRRACGHGRAHQAPANLHVQRAGDLVGIANGIGDRQFVMRGIEQVDRKRVELRDTRDQLRDFGQQLVDIEH